MMPKELPGFYFDAEKNRYFPIKGRIPGSSSSSKLAVAQKPPDQPASLSQRSVMRTTQLLRHRELNGNVFPLDRARCSFQEEVHKIQASRPVVLKYRETEKMCDCALEQMQVDVQTPEGVRETDALLAGGINSALCILFGNVGQHFDNDVTHASVRVWSKTALDRADACRVHQHVWRPPGYSLHSLSRTSSIKLFGEQPHDCASGPQHALITSLGSEISGGYVYVLNLCEPVDFASTMDQRVHAFTPFDCTIWTADYHNNKSQAVVGTNLGAALVNLVTGRPLWICRTKSDVFSLQFDQSGSVVLCGLRNGAILTVDVREKQGDMSTRYIKHKVPYSEKRGQTASKKWFEVKGDIFPSSTIYMPSSVSSLVSLQLHEQYFLASSMDGSIKLYDHRLVARGAVQSYEGHVNSHSRLQLGVDTSERFVMSGGEDCSLRLWSIKSGEMLFNENFSSSVLSTVCWQGGERCMGTKDERQVHEEQHFLRKECHGAWLGSLEGLFHVSWS